MSAVKDAIEKEVYELEHYTLKGRRDALGRIARLAATEAASEAAQHYGVPSGYMGAVASIVSKVLGEGGAT